MSHVPDWWQAILLALAAYRCWRLIALDVITAGFRRWVTRLGPWMADGDVVPVDYREDLAEFIRCPWCLGFWTAAGWWAAWLLWPHASLVAAVPFALSAAVGMLALLDD